MKTTLSLALSALLVAPLAATLPAAPADGEPSAYVVDLLAAPALEEPTTPEPDSAPDLTDETTAPATSEEAAPDDGAGEDAVGKPAEAPKTDAPELDAPEQDDATAAPAALAPGELEFDLVTEPMETNDFLVAGVTWEGASPEAVEIRTLTNGEWGEWYALDIEDEGEGTPSTEPYMAAGSSGIQVRVAGANRTTSLSLSLNTGEGTGGTEEPADVSEPEVTPEPETDLEPATNVDSHTGAAFMPALLRTDSTFTNAAATAFGNPARAPQKVDIAAPKVISREEWGAKKTSWPPETVKLSGAIIHHTAGNNVYTEAQGPAIVKAIWNYHAFGREWGDIGYNFLIDKYGNIYEGRTGSLASAAGQMVIGAHAAPANTGSVGISVMGNYTSIDPTQVSLDSVATVLAWQFGRAGLDPFGTFIYTDHSGVKRSINAISGHLDVAATACPARIYPKLGQIRAAVAKLISDKQAAPGTPNTPSYVDVSATAAYSYSAQSGHGWPATDVWGLGDANDDALADLLLRTADGRLLFYAGRGEDQFMPGRQIGHGWQNMASLVTGIDFDGDGINDILGIHADKRLYFYPGNGTGGVNPGRQIGHGWAFTRVFGVAQGPGGKPALVGLKAGGDLYIYATNGAGSFTKTSHPAGNYAHLKGATFVGDWSGSGYSDAIAIGADNNLYYYADITEGGYGKRARIGSRWNAMAQLELGYSEGNLHRFYAITKGGLLYTYGYESNPR
ncbi:N-acetylmuramoyl-L-alanine amidase [Trueperella bernardiae]|uniref:N-acetylmuramoyl-L-alanine amidase n=1 Tax=Trueperella bernardiae TaxID=59561 RepID=UPI00294A2366|nr:N-acetylmuramoyl-L-alanine amidase [Trueperella bernardiae]MDV6238342.1 N-acetylmuramoyl-L-alanine amidase [Trueperella bernardiae]